MRVPCRSRLADALVSEGGLVPKVPTVEDLKSHERSRAAARRRWSPDRFHEFSVEIGFDAGQAVVGVGGDIDAATAPLLSALLDVLVEHGHTDIVLDLATLAFMDAAGLSAFATVAERLKRSDGVLTIRSAPPAPRRSSTSRA